jgi:hypothetical protein
MTVGLARGCGTTSTSQLTGRAGGGSRTRGVSRRAQRCARRGSKGCFSAPDLINLNTRKHDVCLGCGFAFVAGNHHGQLVARTKLIANRAVGTDRNADLDEASVQAAATCVGDLRLDQDLLCEDRRGKLATVDSQPKW